MIACSLAEEGAAIAVNDFETDVAVATVDIIKDNGGEALAIGADVSNENEVVQIIKLITEEFGPIGILVNNAGISGARKFLGKNE